ALKKAAAIDPVVFVVVRDIIGHSIGFWFGLFFDRLPYTCAYRLRPILFPGSLTVRLGIADSCAGSSYFSLCVLFPPTLVFAKTPRSGVGLERGV
ncbi:MAG: hypothetical protein DMF15_09285, partial [Verrucomicrobia bacterium]